MVEQTESKFLIKLVFTYSIDFPDNPLMPKKYTKSEIVILSVGQAPATDITSNSLLLREVQNAGLEVTICRKIHQVFFILERRRPCIVVIDVFGSGRIDGTILASSIRSNFEAVILLFVGPTLEERIFGLRSGADVCLSKPIEYSVVAAYLHALGRRTEQLPTRFSGARERVFKDPWVLERRAGYLRTPNGTKLPLSSAEIIFLEHLFKDERNIFMHERLNEVCIFSAQIKSGQSAKNLAFLVSRLRHKVSAVNLYFPILTLRGVGYQFTDSCVIDQVQSPIKKIDIKKNTSLQNISTATIFDEEDRSAEVNNTSALIDRLKSYMNIENDSCLARELGILPVTLGKLRSGLLIVDSDMLIRMHETSGLSIWELKTYKNAMQKK